MWPKGQYCYCGARMYTDTDRLQFTHQHLTTFFDVITPNT